MSIDPHWVNVSLALPMEGANGSTTFTDYSPTPKTISRFGNTQISTAQSKWGNGSGYFDGVGDYLSVSDTNTSFAGMDATVEFWVNFSELKESTIIGTRHSSVNGAWWVRLSPNSKVGVAKWNAAGSTEFDLYTTEITLNTFHHISICKSSNIWHISLDGVITASSGVTSDVTRHDDYWIGRTSTAFSTRDLNGYLQDLRITKGVARYTANFTPPTEPLFINKGSISGTVYEKNSSGVYVPGAYPTRLYKRSDGSLVASTTSAEDGSYTIADVPVCDGSNELIEYYAVALDTAATWQTPGLAEQVFPS